MIDGLDRPFNGAVILGQVRVVSKVRRQGYLNFFRKSKLHQEGIQIKSGRNQKNFRKKSKTDGQQGAEAGLPDFFWKSKKHQAEIQIKSENFQ